MSRPRSTIREDFQREWSAKGLLGQSLDSKSRLKKRLLCGSVEGSTVGVTDRRELVAEKAGVNHLFLSLYCLGHMARVSNCPSKS